MIPPTLYFGRDTSALILNYPRAEKLAQMLSKNIAYCSLYVVIAENKTTAFGFGRTTLHYIVLVKYTASNRTGE